MASCLLWIFEGIKIPLTRRQLFIKRQGVDSQNARIIDFPFKILRPRVIVR